MKMIIEDTKTGQQFEVAITKKAQSPFAWGVQIGRERGVWGIGAVGVDYGDNIPLLHSADGFATIYGQALRYNPATRQFAVVEDTRVAGREMDLTAEPDMVYITVCKHVRRGQEDIDIIIPALNIKQAFDMIDAIFRDFGFRLHAQW